MNETSLKADLMECMRTNLRGFIGLRHEDKLQAGIPDISVTGLGRTSWWEAKFADPDFTSRGIQELTMLRLAAAGHARYLIYDASKFVPRILIVHPKHFKEWATEFEAWVDCRADAKGAPIFDQKWVVDHIRRVHAGERANSLRLPGERPLPFGG